MCLRGRGTDVVRHSIETLLLRVSSGRSELELERGDMGASVGGGGV